jgi:LPXTG-site transpeptidase (sortase) family protein
MLNLLMCLLLCNMELGLNKVGNTVIIGHNYRNGTFFGSNKKMNEGDKVYITDLSGNRVEYTIYSKYITPQADYSYAQRDTAGKREITLVTCHSNNKYRLILCARE